MNYKGIKDKVFNCIECGSRLPFQGYGPTCNHMYCDGGCQQQHKQNVYIIEWKAGKQTGIVGVATKAQLSKHVRRYLFTKHKSSCVRCGWGEVNSHTNLVPLHVHHVDGDWKRTVESNLELLCPNCHSLTENHGSRNKKSTRHPT